MKRHFVIICSLIVGLTSISAQEVPSINPTATYIDSTGKEEQSENYSGQAPLIGRFEANPYDTSGWNEYYEWRFTREQEGEVNREPYLIRYEQDTEYTFTESGLHKIVCYAVFTQGNDTIAYTQDYWDDEMVPLKVTISESKLTMPNAFSPNGDEFNNTYKAKEYQSIVEFHAIIFNRWGQKIYEWFDPAGEWDGTHNGNDVREGVYFVDVKAKGADGRRYHIRRDVNLIRGFKDVETTSSTTNNN